jgi:Cytochrome P450
MMQVLTQVLCRLLSNPEYIEPLRQEVEDVIAEEGWTKAGIDKMRKLDSFLRETQRIDTLATGLLDSLNSSAFTDPGSSYSYEPTRSAAIHIFQRHNHPGGHTCNYSVQWYPYG